MTWDGILGLAYANANLKKLVILFFYNIILNNFIKGIKTLMDNIIE